MSMTPLHSDTLHRKYGNITEYLDLCRMKEIGYRSTKLHFANSWVRKPLKQGCPISHLEGRCCAQFWPLPDYCPPSIDRFRVRCGGGVRIRQSDIDFNERGNNLAAGRKWAQPRCPAEFSSNLPQHTCMEVSSMPSKSLISCLISCFRCV